MNTTIARIQELWGVGYSYVLDTLNYLDRIRLLTPEHSHAVIVGASAILTIPIVWVMLGQLREKWRIALTSMTLPVFVMMMLQVPTGFHGTPDDNCAKYGDGKLNFVLIDSATIPKTIGEIYGEEWLLLLVRAPDRWGDEPHHCRLPMSEDRFRRLDKAIQEFKAGGGGGGYARNGSVHFTFGSVSRGESPNVSFRPTTPGEEKPGPPEVPRSRQRDT